jgi:hypothetical protein
MVGASFTVAAVAQVLRSKKGITAFGNAQISTAQSQFGGASALFDGTGDFLTVENVASGITADQTFEFWIRFANLPSSGGYRMVAGDGGGTRYIGLLNDGGSYRWEVSFSDGQYVERFTTTVNTNTWYHVALTKSGSTLRMYQGGTQLTSAVSFNTMSAEKTLFVSGTNYIGSWNTDSNFLNGWMDEIRVSNNVRYTANFTPSTTAFINDANTVLLIHADGTNASTFFEDDNGIRAQRGVTAVNQTKISTTQSQFGGSSAEFDGNDDYLTVSGLPSITGDCTIEFWGRFDILPWNQTLGGGSYMMAYTRGATDYLMINRSGAGSQVSIQIATGNRYGSFTKSGVNLAINTWYHIAVVRSSGVFKVFFNGTDLTTFINDSGFTNSGRTEDMAFGIIGRFVDSRGSWDGFIDEFRVSSSARYTGDFTPSTAPFVNDANTLLLIHADGTNNSTVFRDDNGQGRTQRGITAFGNAQVDTAQSQFGGASALFDGTGDFLTASSGIPWHISPTGTIELWFRLNSTAPSGQGFISQYTQGSANGWMLGIFSNKIYWWNSAPSGVLAYDFTLSANTWYHLAVVKESSSVLKIYLDGILRYTNSSMGSFTDGTSNVFIGQIPGTSSGSYDATRFDLNGWIDEVRLSNIARYTANFTAPTQPFQNDANTLLLIHADGTDGSTVFTDDNGIAPFTP